MIHDFQLRLTDWFLLLPLALIMYIAQLPGLGYMRIDGLALFVGIFSIYRLQGFPLALVFLIGLIQDIVSLAPLGQHAIGLVALAYFMQRFRDRVLMQSTLKQIPTVFVSLLMVKFIHSWVVALGFGQLPTLNSILSVLFTTALWPFFVTISHRLTYRRGGNRHKGFT